MAFQQNENPDIIPEAVAIKTLAERQVGTAIDGSLTSQDYSNAELLITVASLHDFALAQAMISVLSMWAEIRQIIGLSLSQPLADEADRIFTPHTIAQILSSDADIPSLAEKFYEKMMTSPTGVKISGENFDIRTLLTSYIQLTLETALALTSQK